MRVFKAYLTSVLLAAVAMPAWAQMAGREPHIGYVYPAGGQRGTTVEVVVGGQSLRGADKVYVSGAGVRGEVVEVYKPLNNISKEERDALVAKMKELFDKRMTEATQPAERGAHRPDFRKEFTNKKGDGLRIKNKSDKKDDSTAAEPAKLPEHPLLRGLDDKSLRELEHVRTELLSIKSRKQPNPQIAESVVVRLTIEANATPGDREIRLGTPAGLTNPMCIQVDTSKQFCELEPNDPQETTLAPDPVLDLPVTVNGQIRPGDVDRFRLRAKTGQKLVIETFARHLVPYLADAVPGWFQATVALYDPKGREVGYADDYRFNPDPVLLYEVPADGVYQLEIRDAIFRGREDFVYRISVGTEPFITEAFPLGGRMGSRTVATVEGWNLPSNQLTLATPPGADRIREASLRKKQEFSNPIAYEVDTLPECKETEPNDTIASAQHVELPRIINGCISQAGDIDVFAFDGRMNSEIVAEVYARRVNSPVDSLVRLMDASGRVLGWNDDHEDKESGLLTHHADSYLRAKLPANGTYYVQMSDAQHHGGGAYAYRLRVSPPRPDFAVRLTPSSVNVRPSGSAEICAYALRKDGFNGDIELVIKDEDSGLVLNGGRIPAGCDRARMTISAPPQLAAEPVELKLDAYARINGRDVRRPAVPADDLMQAFIYRHLVPAGQMLVAAAGPRRPGPSIEFQNGDNAVKLAVGGTTSLRIRTPSDGNGRRPRPNRPLLQDVQFELSDPPPGVTLAEVKRLPDGLEFVLKADKAAAKVGRADNVIIEAFLAPNAKQQPPNKKAAQNRVSVGVLPAVPLEIVQR